MKTFNVTDVRSNFVDLLTKKQFTTDKSGVKTIEIINASFEATDTHIFGAVNEDYARRELAWYRSLSRNVNDIPGGPPAIWQQVASRAGNINSNYGWCVYSDENGNQFSRVLDELTANVYSRRATMIYTRPTMHKDYNTDGMSDFVCTNTVQYFIREGLLHALVYMRSNDGWAGYRNDYHWQNYIHKELLTAMNQQNGTGYGLGTMYWNVASLHMYERQFYLVEHYDKTGETSISKSDYLRSLGLVEM